ncbi:MAG: fumarate hydratase [Methanomassiliicoccales archaeon]|jgi:fumarate hydratase subunit alpha|nr:fumarate hydratase [Methanomassiliicoccales archaeon]
MMISSHLIEEVVVDLLRRASMTIPSDVLRALENSIESEVSDVARVQLQTILENVKTASACSIPLCQDTGIPLFFVRGECTPEVMEGIKAGVRRATEEIPLRPNVVHPITRKNPGNNIGERMPYVHFSPGEEDYFEITVMPKGAGSENMSALKMLNPSDGLEGIKAFILETIVGAGGKPCPPVIVGVGIGGSSDIAMTLAKEALLVSLEEENPDPDLSALEREIHSALNQTGIGPMGLGGRTTVLGVKIKTAYCHTASLPVAINLQCWAARRATARVFEDGTVIYLPGGSQ